MQHVHPHNRLTSLFEIVNHTLSTLLILFTGGTVLILWTKGLASVGSVAAARNVFSINGFVTLDHVRNGIVI